MVIEETEERRRKDGGLGIIFANLRSENNIMARVKNNLLLKGMSGAIGKDLVLRTKNNETYSGKYPDMSGIVPSKNQARGRKRFAEAVKFAQSVLKDSGKYSGYKARKGHALYHSAITDYMRRFNPDQPSAGSLPDVVESVTQKHSLTKPKLRALMYISDHKRLSNSLYQKINEVSKATATRHLQEMVELNIIKSNGGRGAGAYYMLGSLLKK